MVCKETAMIPMRKVFKKMKELELKNGKNISKGNQDLSSFRFPFIPEELDPITFEDFKEALSRTKPSPVTHMKMYTSWEENYGSR